MDGLAPPRVSATLQDSQYTKKMHTKLTAVRGSDGCEIKTRKKKKKKNTDQFGLFLSLLCSFLRFLLLFLQTFLWLTLLLLLSRPETGRGTQHKHFKSTSTFYFSCIPQGSCSPPGKINSGPLSPPPFKFLLISLLFQRKQQAPVWRQVGVGKQHSLCLRRWQSLLHFLIHSRICECYRLSDYDNISHLIWKKRWLYLQNATASRHSTTKLTMLISQWWSLCLLWSRNDVVTK